MTKNLAANIFKALLTRSRSTSLRKLERKGLKRVSVVDMEALSRLIREAVDRTLAEMGIHLRPDDLDRVNEQTREQVLKLVSDRERLSDSMRHMEKELAQLRENFRRVQEALQANHRRLRDEEDRFPKPGSISIPGSRMEHIEERLQERLASLLSGVESGDALRERAVELVRALIMEERELALEEAREAHRRKVENLKRRIEKLKSKLDETETLLERVRREQTLDPGLSSEFREAQGLKDEDVYYEEKKALLREIFELNMDLKRLMAEQS